MTKLTIRPRRRALASVAAASMALLTMVRGAPVVVTNYKQLVGTVGSNNDYDTGERFSREGLVLVHQGDKCLPEFDRLGLMGFDKHPEMYALVSVDTDHAEKELLSKLGVRPEDVSNPQRCPVLSIIPRRSTVEAPAVVVPEADRDGSFHLPAVLTQQVSVGVVNDLDFTLDIHFQWWDDPVTPTHIRTLAPGTEDWMLSYKTTHIIALNKETQEEVGRHLVKGHGLFTLSDRCCTAETCGKLGGEETPQDSASREARKQMNERRLANNKRQPEELPHFTEVGFKKMTVPDDVWDLVKTYYEENKNSPPKREMAPKDNGFTNNLEAPSYVVTLPENGVLKQGVFEGLRPILEEWSGVELVPTACYGVRVYTNTTWMKNHLDNKVKDAVSVIIQVDQDVEEDWPLMIYDHAGHDHNITMKPRDLVLYESSTCMHGRPSTFNGNFYANAFVHYTPKDPEKWSDYIK